jgi:hypothetical protein
MTSAESPESLVPAHRAKPSCIVTLPVWPGPVPPSVLSGYVQGAAKLALAHAAAPSRPRPFLRLAGRPFSAGCHSR